MNRRDFLGSMALGAMALPGMTMAAEGAKTDKPFKVCLFSDLHYNPSSWLNSDDQSFLEQIQARAEREQCDMVLHLGDFVHNVTRADEKAFIKKYNDFAIPSFHCLGNHDQDGNDYKLTLAAYNMPEEGYYYVDKGGFRFIILDPNYVCEKPGEYIHHSSGNYFKRSKTSTINWLPPAQVEWLKDAIRNSPYPCVIGSHQSLERPNAGINNRHEIRQFFREINAKRPGHVRLVMNGHMHIDHLSLMENIAWLDVNSANFQWFGATHDKYPAELTKRLHGIRHTLAWTKPLSAIISLWPDGRIKIEGSRADYHFGITPEMANLPLYENSDRITHPEILSAELKINC